MIGTDFHKRTHTAVALDEVGRRLAEKTVPAVLVEQAMGVQALILLATLNAACARRRLYPAASGPRPIEASLSSKRPVTAAIPVALGCIAVAELVGAVPFAHLTPGGWQASWSAALV